jgi:hypothetical protein
VQFRLIASDNSRNHARVWFWVFTLSAFEAAAGLAVLAGLPSDAEGGLLGFSPARLALMTLLLVLGLVSGLLAWSARRAMQQGRPFFLNQRITARARTAFVLLLPPAAAASLIVPALLHNFYRTSHEFFYLAYYQRLLPLFLWLALFCTQCFLALVLTSRLNGAPLAAQRPVLQAALFFAGLFGLLWLFVAITGLGVTPDLIGWGRPAVALLEWQIGLAWLVGSFWLAVMARRGAAQGSPRWVDWVAAAAIWILAAGLWLSEPIRPSFFATAGRAPNHEIYPFSDGAYYGSIAQSLLIGEGFRGDAVPPRPLYITLLAGIHALVGQQYEHIAALQVLLLAFFPVVLYFLGKELHSRPAGAAVALLAIFRELTALIGAPFIDNVSNSKLFFADVPTAMALSLWMLVVVRWLKNPDARPLAPLAVGGGLGLAMLFRTQSMFILPVVLLLALFVLRFQYRRWLHAVALVAIGLTLAVAPWLWRNWQNTGAFAFDDARTQTGSMAARYSLSGSDPQYAYQPGEDEQAYATRVTAGIFRFLFEHPGVVARFVSSHFFHAQIENVLILPIRGEIAGPTEFWFPSTAFWEAWDGSPSPGQAALLALWLGLYALGLGAAWARLGWAGVAPLLANMAYNFSMSLARNSGGRYLLAVDWVMLLYIGVALIEISLVVMALFGVTPAKTAGLLAGKEAPAERAPRLSFAPALRLALVFLLAGSVLALAERAFPQRYLPGPREVLVEQATQDSRLEAAGVDPAALRAFAATPGVKVIQGRALYPRYYAAGEGEPKTSKVGYRELDYARTVFLIAAPGFHGLAIFASDEVPASFPNASDITVLGCAGVNYIEPVYLLVAPQGEEPGGVFVTENGPPADCADMPAGLLPGVDEQDSQ